MLLVSAVVAMGGVLVCASRLFPNPQSSGADLILVGGWEADYVLEAALNHAERHPGSVIVVTGGRIDQGASLIPERNFAELGVRRLNNLGATARTYQSAGTDVFARERVYAAALGFRSFWANAGNGVPDRIDVFTDEWRARSTQLYYEAALPENVTVGVVPASNPFAVQGKWWRESRGVRTVVEEMLNCIYIRFFLLSPVTTS